MSTSERLKIRELYDIFYEWKYFGNDYTGDALLAALDEIRFELDNAGNYNPKIEQALEYILVSLNRMSLTHEFIDEYPHIKNYKIEDFRDIFYSQIPEGLRKKFLSARNRHGSESITEQPETALDVEESSMTRTRADFDGMAERIQIEDKGWNKYIEPIRAYLIKNELFSEDSKGNLYVLTENLALFLGEKERISERLSDTFRSRLTIARKDLKDNHNIEIEPINGEKIGLKNIKGKKVSFYSEDQVITILNYFLKSSLKLQVNHSVIDERRRIIEEQKVEVRAFNREKKREQRSASK